MVNETPQEKLIRELRQENERLKQLMEGRGGPSGAPLDDEARREFLAQIEELKRAKEEAEKTIQERLQESEVRRTQTVARVEVTTPHLMNLNEDPLLSGHIKHPLKPGESSVGRPGEGFVPDIPVQGLGVEEKHCSFMNTNGHIRVAPGRSDTAKVLVNGNLIKSPVDLKHEDRIRIGNHLFFLYIDPSLPRNPEITWELASREANEQEIQSLLGAKEEELRRKMQEEMEKAQRELAEERKKLEKLHAEKEQQDQMTRKQIEDKEREMQARHLEMNEELKRKEMELKKFDQDLSHKKKIEDQLSEAFKLSNDASARAAMLGKKPRFKPEFHKTPGPDGRIGKGYEGVKVRMRVLLPELDDSVKLYWDAEKLEGRIPDMTEMTGQYMNGVPLREIDVGYDPFEVSPQDIEFGGSAFGQCSVLGTPLYHLLDIDESNPIYDVKGVQIGTLHVKITPKIVDEGIDQEEFERMDELIGQRMKWEFEIPRARDIPRQYANKVYCTYVVPFEREIFRTLEADGTDPQFNYRQEHAFIVTRENSQAVQEYTVTFSLYGTTPAELQAEAVRKLAAVTAKPDLPPGTKQPKAPVKPEPVSKPIEEAKVPAVDTKKHPVEESKAPKPAAKQPTPVDPHPPTSIPPSIDTKPKPREESKTGQFESSPSPYSVNRTAGDKGNSPPSVVVGRPAEAVTVTSGSHVETGTIKEKEGGKSVPVSQKSGCCVVC